MYGLQKNCFAKIWDVRVRDKSVDLRVSVSHKNRDGEGYSQDFGGYIRVIGDGKKDAESLVAGDNIKITSDIVVSNNYVKASNTTYTNIMISSFEKDGDSKQGSDGDDELMPFN